MMSGEVSRRQFLKYGLAATAALAGGGLVYRSLKGSGAKMTDAKYGKVLLIGVDGMDPKVTGHLIKDGKLPNLEALSKSGSFMELATSNPPNSPVAWTSIATGRNPGKHNLFDFIRRDAQRYIPELSLSKTKGGLTGTQYESYVKAEPFWAASSKAGVPTTVIRWPVTFPAEEVKGRLLSGLGVPDIRGFLSGYTYYTSKQADEAGKSSNKVVVVSPADGVVETEIAGPKTQKGGQVVDVTVPMKVKLGDDSASLTVDGKDYDISVGNWSGFIRAKFKVGMMKSVSGIFKAYLSGTDPFGLYVTAVQVDPADPLVPISYPSGYSAELADDIGGYYTLGMPEETDGFVDERLTSDAFIAQVADIEEQRDRMFWNEYPRFERDGGLFSFVIDSSDRMQHVFWSDMVLASGPPVSEAVADYFAKKDEFIGQVMEKVGDDTLFMLISDHGFTSFERGVSLNTWLVDAGLMTLKKKIPDGEDGALFRYVDWDKTKAYSLGFNSVYVNLKGREGNGIVKDRESVVDDIVSGLEGLKDDAHGKRVVHKAVRRDDVYSGEYVAECQDVIVGFNPGYRMAWQTAIGGFTQEVLSDNTKRWCGDHLVDPSFVPGVLFSNQKIASKSASQMDVAPTVLSGLGVPLAKDYDGKSLID